MGKPVMQPGVNIQKSSNKLRRLRMDTSPHKSSLVEVNGVHLHYLDWGGSGPVLLFLAGMGCNAHIFDRFALRFIDRFHVLALTRRGHGESDHPGTGYDIDTLTEDIHLFLDRMGIGQVILAGHSFAGVEMSHFAALHPGSLLKLVYLDASFYRNLPAFKHMQENNPLPAIQDPLMAGDHYSTQDYFASMKRAYPSLSMIWDSMVEEQSLHEITILPDGKVVDRMSDAIAAALGATMRAYEPEDIKIRAPVLSFFAIQDAENFISDETMTMEQQAQVIEFFSTFRLPWLQKTIELFRSNVPHARIVEIPHGHHYCFISHEELVFDEMSKFLLS
jgi:non-heme chloroperoxidase